MKITKMSIDDYDEAASLWRSMDEVGLDEDIDSKEGIAKYLQRNPGLSLVIRSQGKLIGTILCGHDGRRGYLHHLAVHPDFRRKGLGKELVDRALAQLTAERINKCNIFVFTHNHDGQNFWQNTGWTLPEEVLIMSKTIDLKHCSDNNLKN